MSDRKFQIIHETFLRLQEKQAEAERVIAADLPGEGMFAITWKSMICKLIDAGARATEERRAGNFLTMLTEELPSAMNYAEVHAERNANSNAASTVAILEEMLELAHSTIGDQPYTDMDAEYRRPPADRRKPSASRLI